MPCVGKKNSHISAEARAHRNSLYLRQFARTEANKKRRLERMFRRFPHYAKGMGA